MTRFTHIAAATSVVLLAACSQASLPTSSACASKVQQSLSTLPQSATAIAQQTTAVRQIATAARRGLWPREGPSRRLCGDVGKGFARCQAWLRTDIQGPIQPDTPGGYAPSDLQTAYGLTTDSKNNGAGQTVAVVDAYENPNAASDLNVYRSQFGLPACTVSSGCFTQQKYTSQTNAGWAGEESVDVDMVSAICPNCKILLVEAASASMADLSTAETFATSHADYVANSWGGAEGTTTYDSDFTCAVITAASGDNGYNATAQWPAILPNVIAVGGTSLKSVSPRDETAWLKSGSGCSKVYAKPSYQAAFKTGCSMRAESDLSADADPHTGVAIYDTFGQRGWVVFGGTSVSTPIVASAFALKGNSRANGADTMYADASAFNDVISGANGTCGAPLCQAGNGWDGPTGLGTPDGINAL